GTSLSELINAPTDVVFSQNLAQELEAEVGDTVQISGASESFTLTGIVPTSSEVGFENIIGSLLGYYYLDVSAVTLFPDITPGANATYVQLPAPDQADDIADELPEELPFVRTTAAPVLRDHNAQVGDAVNDLVVLMGLLSPLIGGI